MGIGDWGLGKYNDAQVNLSSFKEITSIGLPYVLYYSYIKT